MDEWLQQRAEIHAEYNKHHPEKTIEEIDRLIRHLLKNLPNLYDFKLEGNQFKIIKTYKTRTRQQDGLILARRKKGYTIKIKNSKKYWQRQ